MGIPMDLMKPARPGGPAGREKQHSSEQPGIPRGSAESDQPARGQHLDASRSRQCHDDSGRPLHRGARHLDRTPQSHDGIGHWLQHRGSSSRSYTPKMVSRMPALGPTHARGACGRCGSRRPSAHQGQERPVGPSAATRSLYRRWRSDPRGHTASRRLWREFEGEFEGELRHHVRNSSERHQRLPPALSRLRNS